jgi:hypothetical protein
MIKLYASKALIKYRKNTDLEECALQNTKAIIVEKIS